MAGGAVTVTFPVVASTLAHQDTSDLDIRARHTREGCRECRLDITAIVAVDILEADLALYRIGLTA